MLFQSNGLNLFQYEHSDTSVFLLQWWVYQKFLYFLTFQVGFYFVEYCWIVKILFENHGIVPSADSGQLIEDIALYNGEYCKILAI